ncbi:MAG TPA: orotidine-5'-phosphate decarboxylase [Candidatus Saccharimonadales bacterium]|jgi:orotidine-5'-phosphate decarboxylase|nr:orotidine-5'-phosphate decarboxylase [Candidatus Saccharimonadales bacterium]
MDFLDKLTKCIRKNNSLLCVGLDPDKTNIPKHLKGVSSQYQFTKSIVDVTSDLVCAFKLNSAFYEAEGSNGILQLKKICDYLNSNYSHIPTILDAKRADIGNTNYGYAAYAFDYLNVGAVTVNPYLGGKTLSLFLDRKDRGVIILCRTSNPGAGEIQDLVSDDKKIYQIVAEKVKNDWNENANCLLVVGATYPEELAEIRKIVGDDMVLLIPGLGAQGGEVEATVKAGVNKHREGIIINSSRSVIFASTGTDFAEAARKAATEFRNEINKVRG